MSNLHQKPIASAQPFKRLKHPLRHLVDPERLYLDIATLLLSYVFIVLAAWNDRLLGIAPNVWTFLGEYLLAAGLAIEIIFRLLLVKQRPWYFFPLIVLDSISILTIIPSLTIVTFSRIVRLGVSAGRMLQIIDTISKQNANPYLILLIYPFVVPIAAALFYMVEHDAAKAQVHNYFQSLSMMMSYSLTVGLSGNHPVTAVGKTIAGVMLLIGLMCVSIIGSALSDRYSFSPKLHGNPAIKSAGES